MSRPRTAYAVRRTDGAVVISRPTRIFWTLPTAKGVHTCEEFDPDPFMAELNRQGLPWQETFDPVKVP